jgi:hypothetical protein
MNGEFKNCKRVIPTSHKPWHGMFSKPQGHLSLIIKIFHTKGKILFLIKGCRHVVKWLGLWTPKLWVRVFYSGQKMLLQISFFKTMQLSISTKPILKEVFINYAQNKLIQLPTNAIVKGNYIFY